jgi:hypothetical protein
MLEMKGGKEKSMFIEKIMQVHLKVQDDYNLKR